MPPEIDSEEIQEYVSSTLEAIENGLSENHFLQGSVDFEMQVVTERSGDGNIDIKIAEAGGETGTQSTTKIEFSVGQHQDTDTGIMSH